MTRMTRARGRVRHCAALVAALGALAAFPSIASAADCNYDGSVNSPPDPSLVDSGGFSWDITTDAQVDDGYDDGSSRSDAFDTMGYLYLSTDNGTTFTSYSNPDSMGCTTEDGDREIVFPTDTGTVTGLSLDRKIYVPSSGLPFARWLDKITNTSGSPITFVMRFGGYLGSDSSTKVASTSSGDDLITEADHWSNTFEDPLGSSSDPLVTFAWDGMRQPALRAQKAGRFDPGSSGYTEPTDSDYLAAEYSVTLAPGEAKTFMHVLAMRLSADDQAAASAAIDAEPLDLSSGLSDAEQNNVQNWSFDADGDGVKNAVDNCVTAANAGQEDLDKDGKGDACDDDIDGDSLTNAQEDALRTDPRKADTDGDGKTDNVDSCPTIAAATDNGCPAPVVLPPPADKTPPVATLSTAGKISLKSLLKKGMKVTVSSNEPASFTFEILATTKSAKLAKVGDLVISTKSLRRGSGKRSVTLVIAKKWRKAVKVKSKLVLRSIATDASGNRTTRTKALKLTK